LGCVAALGAGLGGAGCTPGEPKLALPPPSPLGPIELDQLCPLAGLEWVVRTKPREIAAVPWLIPAIARFIPESNQAALQARLGFDPRQVAEALFVSYGALLGGCQAQLVRHNVDPAGVEQRFLARLTRDVERRVDHPEVIRLHGTVGKRKHGLTLVGREVAVFDQMEGSGQGVARVAALFATDALKEAKPLRDDVQLRAVVERFGAAPVVAVAPGPFVDEWQRAARGLLAAADFVAASASPAAATESLRLSLAILGDFGNDGSKAADLLRESWQDLASESMGRLLGFGDTSEPVAAGTRNVITLNVMVDPNRLAAGLAALLEQDLEAIMRL
jgi:hypothetical protein